MSVDDHEAHLLIGFSLAYLPHGQLATVADTPLHSGRADAPLQFGRDIERRILESRPDLFSNALDIAA
jgi:hypothetical protein